MAKEVHMESNRLISRFRNSIASQSIRRGLTLAIPFLIMGSFSLLFRNFPSDSYQLFIRMELPLPFLIPYTTSVLDRWPLSCPSPSACPMGFWLNRIRLSSILLFPYAPIWPSAEVSRSKKNTFSTQNGYLPPCALPCFPVSCSAGY